MYGRSAVSSTCVLVVVWPFSPWTEQKKFLYCFLVAFGTSRSEVTKYKERQNSRFGTSTNTFINKMVDLKGCGCSVFLESNIMFFLSFFFLVQCTGLLVYSEPLENHCGI